MSEAEEAAIRDRIEGIFEVWWSKQIASWILDDKDSEDLKKLLYEDAQHHYIAGFRDGMKRIADAAGSSE